uniref:Uncharacterized protein n=1 Tax=Manihot esculenta TaxID=3983 RepID=A0A2C9U3I9_MANES
MNLKTGLHIFQCRWSGGDLFADPMCMDFYFYFFQILDGITNLHMNKECKFQIWKLYCCHC